MVSLRVRHVVAGVGAVVLYFVGPPAQAAESHCEKDRVQKTVELINQERKARGLHPVECSEELSRVAQSHSQDMCDNDYTSHVDSRDRPMEERYSDAGIKYRTGGENIARGPANPKKVHEGWMQHPEHRKNILMSGFRLVGIGYVECGQKGPYWTQNFTGISQQPKPARARAETLPPSLGERLYAESLGGVIGGASGLAVGATAAWTYADQYDSVNSNGWIFFTASAGILTGIPTGVYLGGEAVRSPGIYWPGLAGAVTGAGAGMAFLADAEDGELTVGEYAGIPAITLASSMIGYEIGHYFKRDEAHSSASTSTQIRPTASYSRISRTPVFGFRVRY